MKVLIVVLVALVAVAAAAPQVDKRLFLPDLGSLVSKLQAQLASHEQVTESACISLCDAVAGVAQFLCPLACPEVIKLLEGK